MKKVEEKDDVLTNGSSIFTEGATPSTNGETVDKPTDTETISSEETVNASPQEKETVVEGDTATEPPEVLDWKITSDTPEPVEQVKPEPQEPVKSEEPRESVKSVEEPKPAEISKEPELQFEEASLATEPNLSDSNAFQRLSGDSAVATPGNESYAELVENMVATQCQLSGVKNLDLTTFGIRAQVLNFPNLSILTYGRHKFLGAPFTEEEENMIIHRLGLHVAQSEKSRIVVRAVQEIHGSGGMSYYSLLFTDSIAQKFANMFNYVVHANLNESDISKLVLVIQK